MIVTCVLSQSIKRKNIYLLLYRSLIYLANWLLLRLRLLNGSWRPKLLLLLLRKNRLAEWLLLTGCWLLMHRVVIFIRQPEVRGRRSASKKRKKEKKRDEKSHILFGNYRHLVSNLLN